MPTNTTPGVSGSGAEHESSKVRELRPPVFEGERASSLLGLAKGAVLRGEHQLAARLYGRALDRTPDDLDALIGLASAYLMLGKGARVEDLTRRALEIAPHSAECRLVLANLRLAQERHQDAIGLLREAIAADPSCAAAYSRLGTILTALGERDAARPLLLRALALDPADADALNSMGNILLAEGNAESATVHYERARSANAGWVRPRLNLAVALERQERLDEAIDALEGALAQEPKNTEARTFLGGLLARTGDTARALATLEGVLADEPDDLPALFLAGTIALQSDQADRAVGLLEHAATLQPDSPDLKINLACAYKGCGRLEEALAVAREGVASAPENANALNTLGSVLLEMKQGREAAVPLARAVEIRPDFFAALANLAAALIATGQPREALAYLARAEALEPESGAVHFQTGQALRELGEFAKAEASLRRGLDLNPRDTRTLYALSALFEQQHRKADARALADQLIAADATFVPAHIVKALAEDDVADKAAAIEIALETAPDDVTALLVAAGVQDVAKNPERAQALYRRVLDLDPENCKACARYADITLSLCDWSTWHELADATRADLERPDRRSTLDIFNLQAIGIDYPTVAAAAKSTSARLVQTLQRDFGELWVPRRVAAPSGRIRIGYLLPYTWFHSLPMVLRHIVHRHDRTRFEVVGFTLNTRDMKDFEVAYRQAFDEFHDLSTLNARQAANRVGAAGIDVLIDVSGHTSISCLPVMAFRPAPVQAHYLGYSITTGAPFIDYLITDRTYVSPEDTAEGTEKLVYLPHTFMPAVPQPIAPGRVRRTLEGLPDDAFVLANFNHPCKFEPAIFAAWMRILHRVPNAVLWFGDWFEATRRNLRRAAAAAGIAPKRLIFAPIAEHAEHLRRLQLADLAIDTFYHGGGITTIDALWAGVPVLTVSGATPSSRLGATLLRAVGLPDMIETSLEGYEERIVALVHDPAALADVRARLEARRESSPLFDVETYVLNLERAYEAMWARYRAGDAPDVIDVASLSK